MVPGVKASTLSIGLSPLYHFSSPGKSDFFFKGRWFLEGKASFIFHEMKILDEDLWGLGAGGWEGLE